MSSVAQMLASYQEPDTFTPGQRLDGHLPGRPVSRSTYANYGCRCAGCRAANAAAARTQRRKRGVPRRPWIGTPLGKLRDEERRAREASATTKAWRALARRHRDEYRALLAEQRAIIAADRGPLPGEDT